MSPILEARGIECSASGERLFDSVDVAVGPGERLAVIGPSGSGKTTLLSVLCGIARPDAGQVLLDGEPIDQMPGPQRGVSIVLQGYGLVSLLTAAENVEVALRAAGHPAREASTAAASALASVGLSAQANNLVEELSGGQQQRTAVARALALRPRLLIADEPTAELDPASRTLTLARMMEITERGAALVIATHDPEVAAQCGAVLDLHRAG